MEIDSWRGRDQRSSQRSDGGPLDRFRDGLTWENAHRLTPELVETLAILDPGPQTGLIQIRHLRGTITDLGTRVQMSLPLPREMTCRESSFAGHSERVANKSPDCIVTALLRCIAWSVARAGPKPILRSYGTNTSLPRIHLSRDVKRDAYSLGTQVRCPVAATGFAPLSFHLGKPDAPAFDKLYDAAVELLTAATKEEEALRPQPGQYLDRKKYKEAWKGCRFDIFGPTHSNGKPIRDPSLKRRRKR